MSVRTFILRGLVAAPLALSGILAPGRTKSLLAQDTASCVLGGPGALCYTKQEQVCKNTTTVSMSIGLTSVSIGSICTQWETVTYYYYKDSGGSTPTKPGLK